MKKSIFLVLLVIFSLIACAGIGVDRSANNEVQGIFATPSVWPFQNVQVNQSRILPPYGLKVNAETALLKINVSASKKEAANNLEALQSAVNHIANLAAENDDIQLESISVSQVAHSSRASSIEEMVSYAQDLDSSLSLELSTDLIEHNRNLIDALIIFDSFLDAVNLPDTITLRALAVETRIGDPEMYRQQLAAQVYQELDAVQEEYGPSVTFEIADLHGNLQVTRLSDTEYYIYIAPTIITKEF